MTETKDNKRSLQDGRGLTKKYVGIYTIVFAVFAMAAFIAMIIRGRSFVWRQDGESQYVMFLAYIGRYMRDFFTRALHGDFTIKMFDFTIGPGSDVGAVFRFHPLDLLSVFVPAAYTEALYIVIDILRMYLAGLSFSLFAFYFRKPAGGVLTGSMVYVFCGFVMYNGLRHPTYISALIVLPYLLLCTERAMRGEKMLHLPLAVLLGFLCNYYFMYMCTIAMGVFILLRFPAIFKEHRVKNFFMICLRLGLLYILGAAMTCATLLPIIRGLGSSGRFGMVSHSPNLLSYSYKSRYYRWLSNLIIAAKGAGSDTPLNFIVLVIPALGVACFARAKEHKALIIACLLEIVMLVVPAGAYIMTGFSSINGRWVFIVSFTVAFSVAAVWEQLMELTRKDIIAILLMSGIWMLSAVYAITRKYAYAYMLIAIAELAGTVLALLLMQKFSFKRKSRESVLLSIALLACLINGVLMYRSSSDDFGSTFVKAGTAISRIEDSPIAAAKKIEDDTFYRVDSDFTTSGYENYPMHNGIYGTSMYNSLLSGPYLNFLYEQENNGLNALIRILDLDYRAEEEALMGVGYYLTSAGNTRAVPYGFVRSEELSDDATSIWENQYRLPFGYTYDTVISNAQREEMTAALRSQALMYAGAVDEIPEGTEDAILQMPEILTVPVEIPETETVKRTDKGILAEVNNAETSFGYERKAGYDCYLRLEGLYKKTDMAAVRVLADGFDSSAMIRGDGNAYTTGKRDYTINLGYDETDAQDVLTLRFTLSGDYELKGAQLIYVPRSDFAQRVEALSEDSLENVQFSENTITGSVKLDSRKLMAFQLLYAKGWKVFVDGKEQETVPVNTAFLGTWLEAGEHEIRLSYTSPGSHPGREIALAAWVCYLALSAFSIHRKKKNAKAD